MDILLTMKQEEKIVKQYLLSQGYDESQIDYEPDGNIPPDFVVDGRLAIEVRRLNQQYVAKDGLKGLEEDRIPINRRIEKTLADQGLSDDDHYWFVSWWIRRPKETDIKVKIVEKELRNLLLVVGGANTDDIGTITKEIRDNHPELYSTNPYWSPDPKSDHIVLNLPSGLGVRLSKNTTGMLPDRQKFEPFARMDMDAGGAVIGNLVSSINYCIAEKTIKVEKLLENYGEWWLMLVDHIAYSILSDLTPYEREQLSDAIKVDPPWSRITIVNILSLADSITFETN